MFYRPDWTAGRFHKVENNSYALMYNLLEGMAYFFEDESAKIIETILLRERNQKISLEELSLPVKDFFSDEEILDFCNDLVNAGLILPCDVQITNERLIDFRKEIANKRKEKGQTIKKTVQEKLPFVVTTAESAYLEVLEKSEVPFSVMFELTYNCNLNCVHCFNPGAIRNETEQSTRHKREELQYSDYEDIIKQLKSLGVVKIILSGGDPFVKKDIWKLINLIYDEGFAFDIYTNGLALENKVEKLASFFPNSVGISIYSDIDEVHDGITKVKGSLRKTKSILTQIGDLGIPLYIKCPIMENNFDSYKTVKTLAMQNGALPQFDINLTDAMDGDLSVGLYLQIKGKKLEVLLRDPDIPLYVGAEAPEYGKKQINASGNFCGAGYNTLNITPEGDIIACNSFALEFGNIRESTIESALKTSETLSWWKQVTFKDYDECTTHERCFYCNRCPGQSLIEHGNFLKSSSANCRIANTRMIVAEKLKKGIDPLHEKQDDGEKRVEKISRIESINHRNIQINKKGKRPPL